jgi:FkbM family methyltransferase
MRTLVQALLRPLGLRLARLESEERQEFGAAVLFVTLKRLGFLPQHILDVGANHGNWTRAALRYFPGARCTLLEPQGHLKIHIQDLIDAGHDLHWFNLGASDHSGRLPFYVSPRDDSSTFNLPEEGSAAPTTLVEVVSLDDLLASHHLSVPDLVKIDAEGFDLKVLQGAKSLLGKTEVIVLEASVACPYENSVAKTVELMNGHGYRLFDITELNRSPKHGVLWLTELAFLLKTSSLIASATSYE